MPALTCLYPNNKNRDDAIQCLVSIIESISQNYLNKGKEYGFMDFLDTRGGTQPPKSQFSYEPRNGYVKFLQIRDFTSDANETYIPINNKNKLCKDNDILLGRYGASVGKILTGKSGAYNVACAKLIITDKSVITKNYLFYLLHLSSIQNQLRGITRGAQGGFNKKDLAKIKLFIPELLLQDTLVNILDAFNEHLVNGASLPDFEFDDAYYKDILNTCKNKLQQISKINSLNGAIVNSIDYFDDLRNAILNKAVQGKLASQDPNDEPASELLKRIKAEKEQLIADKKIKKEKPLPEISDEEIPFELPNGWEWCRLGSITNYGSSEKTSRDNLDDDTWVLDLEDVEKVTSKILRKVRLKERPFKSNYNIFYKDDVLYGKLRPYLDKVVFADENGVCTTEMLPIRGYLDLNPMYLKIYLKAPSFIKYANSSTHGMTLPRLSKDMGRLAIFCLPPLAEQKRIVAKVDELMSLCDQLETQIQESKENADMLMQFVLQDAFAA